MLNHFSKTSSRILATALFAGALLLAGCTAPKEATEAQTGDTTPPAPVPSAPATVFDQTFVLSDSTGPPPVTLALNQTWTTLHVTVRPESAEPCPQMWGGPAPHGPMGHMGPARVLVRSPDKNETTVAVPDGTNCDLGPAGGLKSTEKDVAYIAGNWTLEFYAYGVGSSLAVSVAGK